jgi:hypothetical protein
LLNGTVGFFRDWQEVSRSIFTGLGAFRHEHEVLGYTRMSCLYLFELLGLPGTILNRLGSVGYFQCSPRLNKVFRVFPWAATAPFFLVSVFGLFVRSLRGTHSPDCELTFKLGFSQLRRLI